jgi:hypothetical protein
VTERPSKLTLRGNSQIPDRQALQCGAVAIRRAGDPNVGEFSYAVVVLKKFGDVPEDLTAL